MRYLYPIVVVVIALIAVYVIQSMVALPEPLGLLLHILGVILIIVLIALVILQVYHLVRGGDRV